MDGTINMTSFATQDILKSRAQKQFIPFLLIPKAC